MSWTLDGRPLRRILVSRQRYLGDIVMASVVLDVLRRGDPGIELGFFCESGHAPALEGHAGLDDLYLLHRKRRGADARARGLDVPAPARDEHQGARPRLHEIDGVRSLSARLRAARYDLVVDLFFNPFSAWLFRLSGIPLRIGGTAKWRRRLYTHTALRSAADPALRTLDSRAPGGLGEHLCRLAPLARAESGQPFLEWLEWEYPDRPILPALAPRKLGAAAAAALDAVGVGTGSQFVLLVPGATWPSKEWPAGNWSVLIDRLLAETDLPLALLLPPNRPDRWRALAERIPGGRGGVLPVLALPAALDLVAACRLMVAVDGGILHAGVGLGRPTVGLFGPTDPAIWFPYEQGGPYRVLAEAPACHPCPLHECDAFVCLPDLKPQRVLDAVHALLEETRAPGQGDADET